MPGGRVTGRQYNRGFWVSGNKLAGEDGGGEVGDGLEIMHRSVSERRGHGNHGVFAPLGMVAGLEFV